MIWPVLARVFSRYSTIVMLPFVAVIGIIGYKVEGMISDKYTPGTAPILQQREERLLENMDSAPKKHNPLEVNLSPSLSN